MLLKQIIDEAQRIFTLCSGELISFGSRGFREFFFFFFFFFFLNFTS